ncbi:hypothetical protein HNY73_016238 [Argiope bruennichi]|uniref:Uncharacterized protein n=1 Tax=Argiope bruennichi TaxID=94029 RepID=A0A8T0EIA4_ARGBR|nr:hypothetical protein HNY73_016238 [Argiope bruennichi]
MRSASGKKISVRVQRRVLAFGSLILQASIRCRRQSGGKLNLLSSEEYASRVVFPPIAILTTLLQTGYTVTSGQWDEKKTAGV